MADTPSTTSSSTSSSMPPDETLAEIEDVAVELAQLAARMMLASEFGTTTVTYKTTGAGGAVSDPVSELDKEIEVRIRAIVGERFPDHEIIGEEMESHPRRPADFIWIVDPIDGTTNFVNGFPLYASSIGVTYRGVPIVGAIWCSTSHTLSPGIYHAHRGGRLAFNGEELPKGPRSTGIRRPMVTLPESPVVEDNTLDVRVTGSAALECAFVAAGIATAAHFRGLSIWDVTAGLALAEAAGIPIQERRDGHWRPFRRFPVTGDQGETVARLRNWKGELVMGRAEVLTNVLRPRWRQVLGKVRR